MYNKFDHNADKAKMNLKTRTIHSPKKKNNMTAAPEALYFLSQSFFNFVMTMRRFTTSERHCSARSNNRELMKPRDTNLISVLFFSFRSMREEYTQPNVCCCLPTAAASAVCF